MTQAASQLYPLLPLRNGVILPGTVTRVPVGRARSLALIDRLQPGDTFVLGVQFDAAVEVPAIADLHGIGSLAVLKEKGLRGGTHYLLLEVKERVRLLGIHRSESVLEVRVGAATEQNPDTDSARALAESLAKYLIELADEATVRELVRHTSDPGRFADRVAAVIDIPANKKIEVLLSLDVEARLRLVSELLSEARTRAELREQIDSEVRRGLGKSQREALLRQQLRAIQKELGEAAEEGDAVEKLRARLDAADLPEEVRETVQRELKRLVNLQGPQPEAQVIRNYLEWIADLPWNKRADTHQDIDAIAATLDADHFGLEEVKRRILEHMAVLKLSNKARGTILALVGPPGVGKTSLAHSVARATGRPLTRVSLGGVRDEAEIRGHRRTYVGALPGRILSALRKAGAKNPVMVLDEIDKLGRGWAGDPEAALLEVLDPEQNRTFTDHFLELPFDLSEVLFIATANDLSSLSPPLRDRLEIIDISGYTLEEKVRIGREHLWQKRLEEHGLTDAHATLDDDAIRLVVEDYTREAGVRQLSRELAKVCRSVALEVARRGDSSESGRAVSLNAAELRRVLGRPKFINERAERTGYPGVAAGLAWTPVGGDVLYVETTRMVGTGKLEITGQLGDVMNESARAALAYLRSHAAELGLDASFLERSDLHIHVPAGGVPKDGPSAGVTIFTALASLLSGRSVRPDTAMTGEATLRGRVLPVGGIKSKLLAAHRAGFTRVILPKQNERHLDDVPEFVRDALDIILADDMKDVLHAALEAETPTSDGTTLVALGASSVQ